MILDRPATLEVAQAHILRAGLTARVAVQPGNALTDDLGTGYDLVLISNVIHAYTEFENRRLLSRAARALKPGGNLAVKDFFFNDDRTGPPGVGLFAINMLVNTAEGDCYPLAVVKEWLRLSGVRRIKTFALEPPSTLLVGSTRAAKPTGEPLVAVTESASPT